MTRTCPTSSRKSHHYQSVSYPSSSILSNTSCHIFLILLVLQCLVSSQNLIIGAAADVVSIAASADEQQHQKANLLVERHSFRKPDFQEMSPQYEENHYNSLLLAGMEGEAAPHTACSNFKTCGKCLSGSELCQWCDDSSLCLPMWNNDTSAVQCPSKKKLANSPSSTFSSDSLQFVQQCDSSNAIASCLSHQSCLSCVENFDCLFFDSVQMKVSAHTGNNSIIGDDATTTVQFNGTCLPARVFGLGLGVQEDLVLQHGSLEYRILSQDAATKQCYFGNCFFYGFLPWYLFLGFMVLASLCALCCCMTLSLCLVVCCTVKAIRRHQIAKHQAKYGAYGGRYARRSDRFYERIQ